MYIIGIDHDAASARSHAASEGRASERTNERASVRTNERTGSERATRRMESRRAGGQARKPRPATLAAVVAIGLAFLRLNGMYAGAGEGYARILKGQQLVRPAKRNVCTYRM